MDDDGDGDGGYNFRKSHSPPFCVCNTPPVTYAGDVRSMHWHSGPCYYYALSSNSARRPRLPLLSGSSPSATSSSSAGR